MQVTVYALSTCPYCKMTRKFLTDKGVDFQAIEVDMLQGQEKADAIAKVKDLSGGTSLPVVAIGDEVIVGFNKGRMKKLLGL